MRDASEEDAFRDTTERNHARNHMSRMSIDNENAWAVGGDFLPEFGNARKENLFKPIDEENFCHNRPWCRPNGVIMAFVQFLGNQQRFLKSF
jgi:hypothetical protein